MKAHVKQTLFSKNAKFLQTLYAMKDNILWSDELLNKIYAVPFAANNFCQGHESNINFKMQTNFRNKQDLHNAFGFIYGRKIDKYKKSTNQPETLN